MNIDYMSGEAFEHFVANLLTRQGYTVEMLGSSGDGGGDIIAERGGERTAIQCKRYSSAVGRRAISDAVGVMRLHRCTRSMAVTSNYFTEGAIELARANDTTLVDRDVLCRWIAQVNGQQDFSAPARTGPSMAGKILRGAAWVLLPQIMLPRAVVGAISGAIRKGAANSRAHAEAEAEAQRRRDVAARHVQMEAEEAARLRQVAAERQRQAEEAAADRIFVVKNGRTGGPFTREQARMFLGSGHLALTDKAWGKAPDGQRL